VFSSSGHFAMADVDTTLVTSMFVSPSAKSSMSTWIRFPVTWRLIRLLLGLKLGADLIIQLTVVIEAQLCTFDPLNKVGCFVQKEKNIFNIKTIKLTLATN
jgi:hypothetical protein